MKIKLSGRTTESEIAIQALASFLERFGEVKELGESILTIDERETVLVAFSSQSYFDRKGYYWFSLSKTKLAKMSGQKEDHAWMVLICGAYGRYFIPFRQIKSMTTGIPSNRSDGRWDLYIRFEHGRAYLGITQLRNHLDVTDELQHFEQIWSRPNVEEIYADEAIYIPDTLPEAERRLGRVLRVVRDSSQSRIVKELYGFKCQICGWTAVVPRLKSGHYCEAHHLKPLGRKFKGPDHVSNIVALCPTHHCMMDLGILAIEPNSLKVTSFQCRDASEGSKLTLLREHGLNKTFLRFHFQHIFVGELAKIEFAISQFDELK